MKTAVAGDDWGKKKTFSAPKRASKHDPFGASDGPSASHASHASPPDRAHDPRRKMQLPSHDEVMHAMGNPKLPASQYEPIHMVASPKKYDTSRSSGNKPLGPSQF